MNGGLICSRMKTVDAAVISLAVKPSAWEHLGENPTRLRSKGGEKAYTDRDKCKQSECHAKKSLFFYFLGGIINR